MEARFEQEAEWVSSVLLSARLEQTALLRLLLKKKLVQAEELLAELNAITSDDHAHSVRRFLSQSEAQLRSARWHIGGAAATERLGRRLSLSRGERVLDVGCGVGGPARQVAETFGVNVVGVDHRFDRILEATLRTMVLGLNSRAQFQVADGEHLPFDDGSFDAAISQATMNWIPDKTAVIREVFRVLEAGGRFGFECEAVTEKAVGFRDEHPSGLFRILAWQQLLDVTGFVEVEIEEMGEEARQFYPSGPERDQIDRGERVAVRMTMRKP